MTAGSGLGAAGAAEHISDQALAGVDLDHRVGRGDGGVHRLVVGERGHVGGNDLLRDQGTCAVVQQDVALLVAEGRQRRSGRAVPSFRARQNLLTLS